MSTTIEDVSDFIWTAHTHHLNRIADELVDSGYEFECIECEEHECAVHDSTEDVDLAKKELIRELIERANQFGLDDMLDGLKREGERIGAYLRIGGQS
ncbi:hypothetical protein [Acinetobacter sp. YH01006]|uniref:hypothetical protein n=1 Tax=Acinetobacter sp. YH01006 TaxID=2601022 RepID=UPI0015D15296|nr:hypothetical protein [Acinetobacter sp. YH01006]